MHFGHKFILNILVNNLDTINLISESIKIGNCQGSKGEYDYKDF